jgi:hypothetical protein
MGLSFAATTERRIEDRGEPVRAHDVSALDQTRSRVATAISVTESTTRSTRSGTRAAR